jgi:hypothetical protein
VSCPVSSLVRRDAAARGSSGEGKVFPPQKKSMLRRRDAAARGSSEVGKVFFPEKSMLRQQLEKMLFKQAKKLARSSQADS